VGAALGHVVGDTERTLELVRLDWQQHAFSVSGPGIVVVPAWNARGLAGREVRVAVRAGTARQQKVVAVESAAESCVLPRFTLPYASIGEGEDAEVCVSLRGPRGAGDDARFPVALPTPVRRLGGSGPARAVMALVACARAGERPFGRDEVRWIRESFTAGIELDEAGIAWLRTWLRELRDADLGRLTPAKVAHRLEPHLDADARPRLVGWLMRGVHEAWPTAAARVYAAELAHLLGVPLPDDAPSDDRAAALAVLGLAEGATAAQIKAAWVALIRTWHPDLAPDERAAVEHNRRTAEANSAYRLLSQPAEPER
jgi:hypothetical protein